jgi:hypothetical protein
MIVDQIEELIRDSEQQNRPLEVDPLRGRLFELFVTAEAAGLVDEDAEADLTADGICQTLSQRWGLKDAARSSLQSAGSLSPDHLQQMRSLWSVMRMWMEWTYAWQRWHEFHTESHDNGDGR